MTIRIRISTLAGTPTHSPEPLVYRLAADYGLAEARAVIDKAIDARGPAKLGLADGSLVEILPADCMTIAAIDDQVVPAEEEP